MVEKKYQPLVDEVIDLVGGKENITAFIHCVTRLRFNVKDRGLVNQEKINAFSGVLGSQWSGEQFQIIIGPNVGDVYNKITKNNNFQAKKSDGEIPKVKKQLGLNTVIDYISGSIQQILPALIGCGMLKVVILILEMSKMIQPEMGIYQLLSFAADAGIYFLPILVGKSAAKKLGANESLGMVMGAMLVYPGFATAISQEIPLDFLGIPVHPTSYANTIFPVILAVAVMAPIQRFFAKYSVTAIRSITEPLLTILVMIPIVYCIVGPIGSILGVYLSNFVLWLYSTTGFFGLAVLGATMPFIVMTGMHSSFTPYVVNMMGTVGYEPIFFPAMVIANINQGIACAAVASKSKNKEVKSIALSCSITGVFGGVTEPGMYGVNLKYKTPMIGAVIGSFIGAAVAGIFKVYVWAFAGSAGLFAIPSFISSKSQMNVVWLLVAIVIGAIATFISTLVLYKEEL